MMEGRLACKYCGRAQTTHIQVVWHETIHTYRDKQPQREESCNDEVVRDLKISQDENCLAAVTSVTTRNGNGKKRKQIWGRPRRKTKDEAIKYKCDFCGKQLQSKFAVQRHIEAVHLKQKPHECDQCDAKFSRRGYLKMHVDVVHLKLKPHECNRCNAKFSLKGDLRAHISAVHLKRKPHKCDQCDTKFSHKGSLKKHIVVIHLNQKPHKCDKCDSQFSLRGYLKAHVDAVHLHLKPHECDHCTAKFSQKGNLRKHIRAHFKSNCMSVMCRDSAQIKSI